MAVSAAVANATVTSSASDLASEGPVVRSIPGLCQEVLNMQGAPQGSDFPAYEVLAWFEDALFNLVSEHPHDCSWECQAVIEALVAVGRVARPPVFSGRPVSLPDLSCTFRELAGLCMESSRQSPIELPEWLLVLCRRLPDDLAHARSYDQLMAIS